MRYLRIIALTMLILVSNKSTAVITIPASVFNTLPLPYLATETTIIELDEDILFSTTGIFEPIQPGSGFSESDRIIFTSTTSNKVIVDSDVIWKYMMPLFFEGNAQLEMREAASLYSEGSSLTIDSAASFYCININTLSRLIALN